MPRKNVHIPVNKMEVDGHLDRGITIERMHIDALQEANLNASDEAKQAHREERHSFFLQEKGTVVLEIDFEEVEIKSPSVIYMHPDQVHRIVRLENVTVSVLSIDNEHLNPEYLEVLNTLTPAKPIKLDEETFALISGTVSLCIQFAGRTNDKLYHSLLKDSCNALVALVTSQYVAGGKSAERPTRFKLVAHSFRSLLESHYTTIKSPAAYAQQLNISTAYLNECVKNATGYPVSYHIQQRIILEAKRLLYHSAQSVKEICTALGYDDYTYFSRLFTKAVGMTPLAFRNKNRE